MIISVKLTHKHEETIDVLRLFKEIDGRVFVLANVNSKCIFLEIIAFNNLMIISDISSYEAIQWIKADNTEMLYLDHMFFYPINILDTEQYLTYYNYNIIYKHHDQYWTLKNSKFNNLLDSIHFPPPIPKSINDTDTMLNFKKINFSSEYELDDFLDKIRKVGYKNLTVIEKTTLDALSKL